MTTRNMEEHWNSYMATFGPVTNEEREQLLEDSVSGAVVFTNPGGEGKTRAGLIAHIEDFRKKMPTMRFSTDRVLLHHGELLAVWSMYKDDGDKVATGYNFVRADPDGRFSYMAGFF